ncbi:MAG TPA: glutathione synthase [Sphingomicrobium sp.]|nr:glutathione synthase [Sphingomicrobium sp.]
MPLRVAVQMDSLDAINIAGDSTFAIMLKAQELGHELFHYATEDLSYAEGRLWTMARPVRVQRVAGDHYSFGDHEILDLGRDVDVVLMRQNPPFDLGYITATHLLERIQGETLVVNDPAGVRNAPEKVWVLDFPQFMPPTAITRSLGLTRKFLADRGDIVIKPLHGFAGGSVFRIGPDGRNLAALMELFNSAYREPHMIQAFLPEIAEGDKRIVLVDGELAGAVNRVPAEGEFRSNFAVGGSGAKTELTEREEEICATLGPECRTRGLLFVGLDVIGGKWLTEINVTSPTGIVAIDELNGTDTPALIWQAIERHLAKRRSA